MDIIPVIVGILIALFINNVQQKFSDRKLLGATLQTLSNEFTGNAAEIQENLPSHLQFIDTLRQFKEGEIFSIYDMLDKVGGFSVGNIFTTNWQATLGNNSLRFLDFQTIKLLSEIDAQHQEMRKLEETLYPIFFGPPLFKMGKEGLEYRLGLEIWLMTFSSNENELLQLYDEFEELVEDKQYR